MVVGVFWSGKGAVSFCRHGNYSKKCSQDESACYYGIILLETLEERLYNKK